MADAQSPSKVASIISVLTAVIYLWFLYFVTVATGLTIHLFYSIFTTFLPYVQHLLRQVHILPHDPEEDAVDWSDLTGDPKTKGKESNPHHLLIIGAGFSGLGLATKLKEEGLNDFVIYERDKEVGGAWYANTYPNCACDVPSNLYSYSWEPNPDWTHFYSRQNEIWLYLKKCAEKYNLLPHIKFNTEVKAATWSQDLAMWKIETDQETIHARFLINGQGPFSDPKIPNFKGMDKYKGKIFHSAKWDHSFDLTGKRVAVIGTGASAIQFVPGIVDKVEKCTIFMRSPPYVVPRPDYVVPKWQKTLFRKYPFFQKLHRACLYWSREGNILFFLYRLPTHKIMETMTRAYIRRQFKDKSLGDLMVPNYTLGCKRVLVSSDWYPALNKSNVQVVPSEVVALTENGVVGKDGTIVECDAVILGTGFEIQRGDHHSSFVCRGKDGIELKDFWNNEAAMKAYKGTTVPNYPNYFILLGPNIGLGHSSVVIMVENQLPYIVSALRYMKRRNYQTVDTKYQAFVDYNDEMQQSLKNSVWNTGGCTSWYLSKDRINTRVWAKGFTFLYHLMMRRFDPENFSFDEAQVEQKKDK